METASVALFVGPLPRHLPRGSDSTDTSVRWAASGRSLAARLRFAIETKNDVSIKFKCRPNFKKNCIHLWSGIFSTSSKDCVSVLRDLFENV
jgi:hypothetical protein